MSEAPPPESDASPLSAPAEWSAPTPPRARSRLFVGRYNPAVALTLLGLGSGVSSMLVTSRAGAPLGLALLVLAGICDLFDGLVARRLELDDESRSFGVQIDTVVDAVAFGAAPAVIVAAMMPERLDPFFWAVAILYVAAAVLRLAHFNVHGLEEGARGARRYEGVPVTYAALWLPLVFVLAEPFVAPSALAILMLAALGLLALAFVLRFPVPKPRGAFYLVFPVMAVGVVYRLVTLHMTS